LSPLENAYRIIGDGLQITHREVEKLKAADENATDRVLDPEELSRSLVSDTERNRLQEISGDLLGEVVRRGQAIVGLMLIIRRNCGKAAVRDTMNELHIPVESKNPGGQAKGMFQEHVAIATQTGVRNVKSLTLTQSVDCVTLKPVEEAGTLESGSESFPPTVESTRMCGQIEGFSERTTFRAHPPLIDIWGLLTVDHLPTGRGGGSAY